MSRNSPLPIRAITDSEREMHPRAEMETGVAERIAASSEDIDALRHVILAVRHFSEHEVKPRGIARRAAIRLLEHDHGGSGSATIDSMNIVEASFPQDEELLRKIEDIHTSWRK